MQKLTLAGIRQIHLVDYLSSLGFHACKVRGNDYWYYSPLRNERTPSFKINRKGNVWYDFGTGEGGNIIDFGVSYHKLDVRGLLEQLSKDAGHSSFSFQPQQKKNRQ